MKKDVWIVLVGIIGAGALVIFIQLSNKYTQDEFVNTHPMSDQQQIDIKVIEVAKLEAERRGYTLENSKIMVSRSGTTASVSFLEKDQQEGVRGSTIGIAGPGLQIDVDTITLAVIKSHFIR